MKEWQRKQRLIDLYRLLKFLWDSDKVEEFIPYQLHIASRQDGGRDVGHLEILFQKFEASIAFSNSAVENLNSAVTASDELIQAGHLEPEKIQSRFAEIRQS